MGKFEDRNKYQIKIKKSEDLYPQCTFCLTKENVYEITSNRSTLVVELCKTCASKIVEEMVEH